MCKEYKPTEQEEDCISEIINQPLESVYKKTKAEVKKENWIFCIKLIVMLVLFYGVVFLFKMAGY